MLVLVRPNWKYLFNNNLFSGRHLKYAIPLEPFRVLREHLGRNGMRIHTSDVKDPREASVYVFMDLPRDAAEVVRLKRKYPHLKMGLLINETPAYHPHYFHKANFSGYDFVITYNGAMCDEQRIFQCPLPTVSRPAGIEYIGFEDRKLAVMLNGNHHTGWKSVWHVGRTMHPYVQMLTAGYRAHVPDMVTCAGKVLYQKRREVAKVAGKTGFPLDVYGLHWRGYRKGWYYNLFPEKPFKCWKGDNVEDKFGLYSQYRFAIVFENIQAGYGYISEKIFDALYSGAVPVYMGDRNISELVPPDCFIAADRYGSASELLEILEGMSRQSWEAYYRAGQNFIASEQIKKFQPVHFARRVADILSQQVD